MGKRTQETLKRHAEADQMAIDTARDREIVEGILNAPNFDERIINLTASHSHFKPQYIRELLDAAEERDALRERVEEQNKLLRLIRDDLKMRSSNGVVDISNFIWERVEQLLSQSNQEPKGE